MALCMNCEGPASRKNTSCTEAEHSEIVDTYGADLLTDTRSETQNRPKSKCGNCLPSRLRRTRKHRQDETSAEASRPICVSCAGLQRAEHQSAPGAHGGAVPLLRRCCVGHGRSRPQTRQRRAAPTDAHRQGRWTRAGRPSLERACTGWTAGAARTGGRMVPMYRPGLSRQRTAALVRTVAAAVGYSCAECRQTKPERIAVLPIPRSFSQHGLGRIVMEPMTPFLSAGDSVKNGSENYRHNPPTVPFSIKAGPAGTADDGAVIDREPGSLQMRMNRPGRRGDRLLLCVRFRLLRCVPWSRELSPRRSVERLPGSHWRP